MNKIKVNFESENLIVDWISLNIANFRDSKVIGDRLFPYFNISITMNDQSRIRFFDQRNIYNVRSVTYTKEIFYKRVPSFLSHFQSTYHQYEKNFYSISQTFRRTFFNRI